MVPMVSGSQQAGLLLLVYAACLAAGQGDLASGCEGDSGAMLLQSHRTAIHVVRSDPPDLRHGSTPYSQTLFSSLQIAGHHLATIWQKAASSAFKGGFAGFVASVAQVLSFMWLRTAMHFQYFNGGTLGSALGTLWKEGGLRRLYQGVSFALVQAPLAHFGDTAANAGVMVLMDFYLPGLAVPLKTAATSTAAAFWRLLMTPIDTLKTASQVQGEKGLELLIERVNKNGFGELYAGALAGLAAHWVGNYPYFAVFNGLSESWAAPDDPAMRIVRNGLLGMSASVSSDVVSNSLRVLKTIRQSSLESEGYFESAKRVIDRDGFGGLLGRGLGTRLLTSVLQGAFFTIIWKLVEEKLNQ